jgi:hypothetical protein
VPKLVAMVSWYWRVQEAVSVMAPFIVTDAGLAVPV